MTAVLVTGGAGYVGSHSCKALAAAGLENPRVGEGDYGFLCTGEVEPFRQLGSRFLQLPLEDVSRVDLRVAVGG